MTMPQKDEDVTEDVTTPRTTLPMDLAALSEMNTAMLAAAEQGRWAEVQRIDDARMKSLKALPGEVFATNDPALRDLLNDALDATRRIERQAINERDQYAADIKLVNRRQHAARSYDLSSLS